MADETRRLLLAALVLGLTAAAIVWWLESFERGKLAAEWRSWVDEWQAKAGASDDG